MSQRKNKRRIANANCDKVVPGWFLKIFGCKK